METDNNSLVRHFNIKRVSSSLAAHDVDTVAAEEPLAIRVIHWFKDVRRTEDLALTMRTPGHDRELVAGLLLSEGIIRGRADLSALRPLGSEPSNEILAELSKGVDFDAWRLARNGFVSSSCGVCGKRSREALAATPSWVSDDSLPIDASLIEKLPDLLRDHQRGFAQTGGLHAAALLTREGVVEAVFEDIGRHNALDKVLGWSVLNHRIPLHSGILFLSSRSSFELIQKAAMAGAPVLATVGGPSSLAIETARERGITLIGFVREARFNVYSGEGRLNL
jgi:FdhD protein